MAQKEEKWDENISGAYYVDYHCIACDACCKEAPDFFAMKFESGHAFVTKQPKTPKEIENCENALLYCPVDAIGSDGDSD